MEGHCDDQIKISLNKFNSRRHKKGNTRSRISVLFPNIAEIGLGKTNILRAQIRMRPTRSPKWTLRRIHKSTNNHAKTRDSPFSLGGWHVSFSSFSLYAAGKRSGAAWSFLCCFEFPVIPHCPGRYPATWCYNAP